MLPKDWSTQSVESLLSHLLRLLKKILRMMMFGGRPLVLLWWQACVLWFASSCFCLEPRTYWSTRNMETRSLWSFRPSQQLPCWLLHLFTCTLVSDFSILLFSCWFLNLFDCSVLFECFFWFCFVLNSEGYLGVQGGGEVGCGKQEVLCFQDGSLEQSSMLSLTS